MAGTKEIKQRIKSVKNTKKITKAMELVAASKMKRAVSRAVASRLYSGYSWDLLRALSKSVNKITHPFFNENEESERTLIVLITSNSGLCGGYNAQVIKKTLALMKDLDVNLVDMITVGKKGDAALRSVGSHILASFLEIPDGATLSDLAPLTRFIVDEYKSKKYKSIYVAYTDFISALNQKPNVRKLLPITKEQVKSFIEEVDNINPKEIPPLESNTEYLFEGDMNTLIETLANKITRIQVYQMLLESSASEQSSRMLAMKNASDAAGEMISDLTLIFNKARQAGITQEISEISAGMASLS
jgi:F-type H+-transporting ATPase subunit gamma